MSSPSPKPLAGRRILLIVGGGIAAYKALDLIRRLRERGAQVRPLLTDSAQEFVTPLAAAALAGERTHTDLFDRESEADIGHIKLARDADAIVVAPATANLMARMATGHAPDLASTVLLATTLPILIAPAMNVRMWLHRATQRNLATLQADGVAVIGPNEGAMAEAEFGPGRLAEPHEIADALEALLAQRSGGAKAWDSWPAAKRQKNRWWGGTCSSPRARPTSRSIRCATSPTAPRGGKATRSPPPRPRRAPASPWSRGRWRSPIRRALPWCGSRAPARCSPRSRRPCPPISRSSPPRSATGGRPRPGRARSRRTAARPPPCSSSRIRTSSPPSPAGARGARPLVVGFAAETDDVIVNAQKKIARKGCDWIVANDVSAEGGVMGGTENTVHLVARDGGSSVETWPKLGKEEVARRLVARFAELLAAKSA
ncbi:Coenzyme A biosynthesis bifunctional protein coaBC (DNA/pantothenate metabolism flavoprotein) [Phosphopantothenoylcysteine decarboxylase (PPCDC) (CoaC); Phosphopantothenate-cysteine ligase (Phosphopantothenoylcysteine synthase) (PPC synthetase) (PPCS) (CoaB)] [Methylorubrum extorquens]|uniref:Uncharacterized protein n=1 Tax=Methylorubrum extorquens TaxID=408 RepID=A0A2N9ALD6_METEX|nr:Coenzyme A biosynthesis bifunctional protein coaBC (DNA/pantothenate metabolism flavoprotein) [Phosphopantothenoylcysteine decarboxylase (PPCDC) (CoaC); Phosphopantothenate-cysteine ligase (Phosphopantothenoylcysteine synthase) (PPC synthetase) (PPCS) (CoaB)] [Methylorubrum extorquens]